MTKKIDLIVRSQSDVLLDRMLKSAKDTSDGDYGVLIEKDEESSPRCASTYNRLASESDADLLCFLHDDIEFLSKGWDRVARELFLEYKPQILGVVGSKRYIGGRVFDSGASFGAGHYCTQVSGESVVKVFSRSSRYESVTVVDGMFMIVSRKFWQENPFDETFDELFFYDLDLCLRAKNVGVTSSIFVKHSKPSNMFGVYPDTMKPITAYWDKFHQKHDLSPMSVGDQRCACVKLADFEKYGQNGVLDGFLSKYGAVA